MRAAVYLGSGEVELRELPEPEPGPGELVVEVELCGICGSDLIEWYASAKAPGVLGHEPVGRVVTAGSSLNGVRMPEIGSRVFVHHHVPCGVCDLCLAGRETLCNRFKETKLQPGGFAERILVSAEHVAKDVLVLPEEVSSEAATLIEPLACCIRGVRKAGIVPRSRVVIIGLGQVGQLYIQASLSYGADVVGVEPIAGRRRLAEVAGAVAVEAEPQAVRQALGDRPPHVVVACTGASGALELAFELAGPATTVQLFAPSGLGARLPVEVNRLFFEEITVQASYSAGPADTRIALELLGRGQVSAEGLITHRFPLSRTGEALRAAKSAPGVVKVVVEGTG